MRKLLLSFAAAMLLVTVLPGRVHASTQDFVINNFDATYTLSNNDKQGELHIVEKIDLTFHDFNHGILRAIPKKYKNNYLQLHVNGITSTTKAPTSYSTYESNGNTVLKIGDATRTVTGSQQYTIDYTVDNVIGFYQDHDELYWDINGDQWQQTFETVHLKLQLGDGLKLNSQKPLCYTGSYGSTASDCYISSKSSTSLDMYTSTPLTAGQTASIVVGFEKGYFTPITNTEKLIAIAKILAPIILIPLLLGGRAYRKWRKLGRDPKGAGTIIAEYGPPDDLRPIEVGTVLDFKADNSDISATIVDLAVRKYIRIIEVKKDRLIGKDKLEYSLELLDKDESELLDFEKKTLSGIRGGVGATTGGDTKGLIVPISDLKNKFYLTAGEIQKQVADRMVTNGYFVSSPLKAGSGLLVFGSILTIGGFFAMQISLGVGVGMILSGVINLLFAALMPARTVKGVEAVDKIKGLKLYLETAEKDRIAMLQSPNAPYAANHDAPKKTVELFEKLLPYAMVLKVEGEWAKQFEGIYNQPPDWYSGNWSGFNTGLLIGSLNSSMASINTVAFSSPSSSGSSGFGGGGGFSGGGGGGGGGGGW